MITEFYNEVLSYGPTAILPHQLNDKWLRKLQKIADDFLDGNFSLEECKDPQDIGDPILTACVYELLKFKHGDNFDITPREMAEKMTIYAVSITMETVNRESNIGLKPPDLDDILSIERIISYKDINPEFVDILKEACIVRGSDKGWFQNMKAKLFSNMLKS